MRVLVTRPQVDAAPFIAALENQNAEVWHFPLMEIVPISVAQLPANVSALAFTSANGVRAFVAQFGVVDLPVFSVGEASASCARETGFAQVSAAGGNVETLSKLIIERVGGPHVGDGVLLHAGGRHRAGDLIGALEAGGVRAARIDLYEARAAQALPVEICAMLSDGAPIWVSLFSPRTAMIFEGLTRDMLKLKQVHALCLSQNVVDALTPDAYESITVAQTPDIEGMLNALQSRS